MTAKLLEEYLGEPNAEKIHKLIERIADGDAAGTLTSIEDLICSGLGEVQIVDALIESMRDLLVIRSVGADTDLVILTANQKEKAGALAQRFDAASLIYTITALEEAALDDPQQRFPPGPARCFAAAVCPERALHERGRADVPRSAVRPWLLKKKSL